MSAIAEQIAAERQAAMRALLAKPLLVASGSDGQSIALVRAHAEWLREWLARNCGWTLRVEAEMVRLRKLPRQLLRTPPTFALPPGSTVFACENPSVVAAAANDGSYRGT